MQVPSMFVMNFYFLVESIFRGWSCKKQLYEMILVSEENLVVFVVDNIPSP